MREELVPLDNLLLDPNNYRFQDVPRYRQVPEARFAESSVQLSALERLESQGLSDLKSSIQHNGFLAVETVVVRPWGVDESKWVVVEGNRRIAALKRLREDHAAGITVNPSVQRIWNEVPVLTMTGGAPADYLAIMGIRHVGGVKRWGSYQSSKLITELHDVHELDFNEIAPRLGLATREITRRYRAFKALNQLERDEEFGGAAQRTMYPLFHEAVSQPTLREWLGWSDSTYEFTNEENRQWFYELLTASDADGDEDEGRPARITTAAEVRELKNVLASEDARRVLRDPSRTFAEALGISASERFLDNWPAEINEAVRALEKLPALTLVDLSEERVALITELRDKADGVLATLNKLRG